LAAERDAAERDSRDKETKILSQSHELEELRNRLADAERTNQQQQAELTEVMSSKDDVGKNVCFLSNVISHSDQLDIAVYHIRHCSLSFDP